MTRNHNGESPAEHAGRAKAELPADATAAQRFAALRKDFAGLEEVCRWQWQLLQQLSGHLSHLPADWPAERRDRAE